MVAPAAEVVDPAEVACNEVVELAGVACNEAVDPAEVACNVAVAVDLAVAFRLETLQAVCSVKARQWALMAAEV